MSETANEENKPQTMSIEERLDYLEEQNAGLKRSGLLLLVLVILMGGTMIHDNSSRASAVQTEGLIINSTGGKPRAALSAMPTGHLGMLFFNHEGNLPQDVQYASIPYLDGFAIYDRQGRPRIHIGMDANDNPVLAVVSEDGKPVFSALPTQQPEESPQPGATPAPGATPTPAATTPDAQPSAAPTP